LSARLHSRSRDDAGRGEAAAGHDLCPDHEEACNSREYTMRQRSHAPVATKG
jgi:hypothetical protein